MSTKPIKTPTFTFNVEGHGDVIYGYDSYVKVRAKFRHKRAPFEDYLKSLSHLLAEGVSSVEFWRTLDHKYIVEVVATATMAYALSISAKETHYASSVTFHEYET